MATVIGAAQMKATILIVDDDAEVIKTFGGWLQLEGYAVRTAADGEAALRQVRGVDAIVLDLRMPILDGLADIESVLRTSRFTLLVNVYERGSVRSFAFELKAPLPDGVFDYVWNQVNRPAERRGAR